MNALVTSNEAVIRLSAFLGVFIIVALWEFVAPRRQLTVSKAARWLTNVCITVLDSLLLRLIFSAGAVGVAFFASEKGVGLFNLLALPEWLEVAASVIILDLLIYAQHVVFHLTPLLWRLHMVHHTDLDLDVTSGARFHPLEIVLSMMIKTVAVLLLGAPAQAVLVFEVLLNATSMFNHGNIRLPLPVDRLVRLLIVTPDMHRVHHSVLVKETNSNYGFSLSIWDRLFRTYTPQPREGHDGMTIGLSRFREFSRLRLLDLLALPFRGYRTEKR